MNTDASPEKPPPPPAPRKVPEIRPPPPAPRQSINTSRQEGRDSTDLASESQASIPDSAPSTPGPHSLATIRQDPSTVGPPQVFCCNISRGFSYKKIIHSAETSPIQYLRTVSADCKQECHTASYLLYKIL